MWKEFLTSIGIGHIKVDTVVKEAALNRGERIEGEVIIHGGIADQPINKISLTLLINHDSYREDSDFSFHEKEIKSVVLENIEFIQANSEKKITFSIELDSDHPITSEKVETLLRTYVDIPNAVDVKDEDKIIIK